MLSVADVAAYFAVTPHAVCKWCEAGKIEFERTPGGSYLIPTDQFDWKRGRDTEAARSEIASTLLSRLEGTEPASEEDMAKAMRQARRRG